MVCLSVFPDYEVGTYITQSLIIIIVAPLESIAANECGYPFQHQAIMKSIVQL